MKHLIFDFTLVYQNFQSTIIHFSKHNNALKYIDHVIRTQIQTLNCQIYTALIDLLLAFHISIANAKNFYLDYYFIARIGNSR